MPMSRPPRARSLLADNRQMLGKLLVVALAMFGFGYALVPVYQAVCSALGINVLSVSEMQTGAGPEPINGQVDESRTVTIEFDANARGPWDFKPAQSSIDVHPGQVATVMVRAMSTWVLAGRATVPSFCVSTLIPRTSHTWR